MSRNHKPKPELDVDPADIPRLALAARSLPDVSERLATAFAGWLVLTHAGAERPPGDESSVRYRKILRRVLDGERKPPSRPRRGQDGYAAVKTLVAATALAASGVAAARGNAPVALASLYITNTAPDELEQELLAA